MPTPSDQPVRLEPVAGPPIDTFSGSFEHPSILGRSAEATSRLPDETVSRKHARVEYRAGEWYITDLGSRHGSFLNGVRLDPNDAAPLQDADLVRIGPYTFRVRTTEETPSGMSTENDLGSTVQRVQRVPVHELKSLAQQRLDLLIECAASINAATDLKSLADAVLDAVCKGTGFPRAALIKRVGTADDEVELVGSKTPEIADASRMTFSRSLLKAAASGEVVRLEQDQQPVNYGESIVRLGIHSALCAPVFLGDSVAAYLYLDARNQESSTHHDAAAFAQAIARMCGLSMANVNRLELTKRQEALVADLNAAREAQKLLMPPSHGEVGHVAYSMHMKPGRFVAGDLFDVIKFEDGRIAVFLGDVTGKGIPAAILMATGQTRLHYSLIEHADPGVAVTEANEHIARHSAEGRFISLWAGIFDADRGCVSFVDAGHGHWLFKPKDGQARMVDSAGGLPLGIDGDYDYPTEELSFQPGDRVVVFSDGVVEQQNAEGEEFGIERAIETVSNASCARQDVDDLVKAVLEFAGTDSLADDLTVTSIEAR